ncbi:MAG TPA: hypothetical protein P5254_07465 [Aquihabitans sp.]|nr:hypothetical protein [Aquihabitans sp.]
MFKRIIWMGTGMAVGAGGAFWAKRKVEATVEQYLPEQVAVRAAAGARGLADTVRAAASEGRDAMRATEAELRARVDARTFVGAAEASADPEPAPRRAHRSGGQIGTGTAGRRRARR